MFIIIVHIFVFFWCWANELVGKQRAQICGLWFFWFCVGKYSIVLVPTDMDEYTIQSAFILAHRNSHQCLVLTGSTCCHFNLVPQTSLFIVNSMDWKWCVSHHWWVGSTDFRVRVLWHGGTFKRSGLMEGHKISSKHGLIDVSHISDPPIL